LTREKKTELAYNSDGNLRKLTAKHGSNASLDQVSDQWQMLEERTEALGNVPERQFVWEMRYADDLALGDRHPVSTSSSSSGSEHVILYACSTGSGIDSLAQALANRLGVPVWAPTDALDYDPDGKPGYSTGIQKRGRWKEFRPRKPNPVGDFFRNMFTRRK
jgi:hypothetical protein